MDLSLGFLKIMAVGFEKKKKKKNKPKWAKKKKKSNQQSNTGNPVRQT